MTAVDVVPVRSRSDHRAFRDLPNTLHRRDAYWVQPLRVSEDHLWSQRNPTLRNRWAARFLAVRGKEVVGRIAAITDPVFMARWGESTGFFGFFECADDVEAATGLLGAAEEALRARGLSRTIGPVNLSTNAEVGLLVEGFDSAPMLLSPYNPPYYADLLERAGYSRDRDYHSYDWDPAAPTSPAVARLIRRMRAGSLPQGVRIRPVDPKRWREETATLFDLYNASFIDVWGFTPMTREEFDDLASDFRRFYRPELVLIAEQPHPIASDPTGGKPRPSSGSLRPVGFALALPDINELLIELAGRLLPFGWLRLMRGIRSIQSARHMLLGVLPEHRGLGIGALLSWELAEAARRCGIVRAELSLVRGGNEPVEHVIRALGGELSKTYRLYGRDLSSSAASGSTEGVRGHQAEGPGG